MTFEHARAVADAILYEGYVLYPYRASSKKNQWRWQFGLLAPRTWSEAGGCEPWAMQTEFLLEGKSERGVIRGSIRALRVQRRTDTTADEVVSTWDEGVEVEIPFTHAVNAALGPRELEILLPGERKVTAGCSRELLPLVLRLTLSSEDILAPFGEVLPAFGLLSRVRIRVENLTELRDPSAARDDVLPAALAGVHALIAAEGARFLSSVDPPEWAVEASQACVNKGAFPVLIGAGAGRDVMLASPIILYDHPSIAPESPGDLCDATEIDEILTLRTLTLTDDEKAEARRTDARAAAIVDRVDAMQLADLAKLHGARRDVPDPVHPTLEKGSRVRLRPRRRADAQDMFLTGRIATVEVVKHDVDGNSHVAVTIDDDPATELHRWYGRFLYFAPDEVELVAVDAPAEVTS